jgi:hypothetical protein
LSFSFFFFFRNGGDTFVRGRGDILVIPLSPTEDIKVSLSLGSSRVFDDEEVSLSGLLPPGNETRPFKLSEMTLYCTSVHTSDPG